jgi:glycine cleavage system H protein
MFAAGHGLIQNLLIKFPATIKPQPNTAHDNTVMSHIPGDLKYSSTHTWAEMLDDGLIKVGITDYAQKELGDIVFVELPEMEHSYTAGEECAVVESVKSASDIYCPVNGEIVEVNPVLEETPEKINSDPYGSGWIFILRPDDMETLDELIDAEEYSELIEEQGAD